MGQIRERKERNNRQKSDIKLLLLFIILHFFMNAVMPGKNRIFFFREMT